MAGCVCGSAGANLGTPNCVADFGIPYGIAFQSTYNGTVLNGINIDSTLTSTVWSDALVNSNKNLRIFPLKNFRQPGQTTEDYQFETANDGYKAPLRRGVMSWSFELWEKDATPALVSKIESFRCANAGVYILTDTGIIGYKVFDGTNNLCAPVPTMALATKYNVRTPANVQKNMVTFDFKPEVNPALLYFIPWSELNSSLETTKAIIDVQLISAGASTVASGSVTTPLYITSAFAGGALNKNTIFGQTNVANYVVKNVTTGTTITPTLVTEGTTSYSLKFPTQTAGNTISIEMATSSGYESETALKILNP